MPMRFPLDGNSSKLPASVGGKIVPRGHDAISVFDSFMVAQPSSYTRIRPFHG